MVFLSTLAPALKAAQLGETYAGHVLVSADYSQIELRLMAAMAGDEAMLEAFRRGEDIHRDTASRVFDVMPAPLTSACLSKWASAWPPTGSTPTETFRVSPA